MAAKVEPNVRRVAVAAIAAGIGAGTVVAVVSVEVVTVDRVVHNRQRLPLSNRQPPSNRCQRVSVRKASARSSVRGAAVGPIRGRPRTSLNVRRASGTVRDVRIREARP